MLWLTFLESWLFWYVDFLVCWHFGSWPFLLTDNELIVNYSLKRKLPPWLQVAGSSEPMFRLGFEIYRREGLSALYNGLTPTVIRCRIHNTSFSSKLVIGPNKLEGYTALSRTGFPGTNTLAYLAHSWATRRMKCCEYGRRTFPATGALFFAYEYSRCQCHKNFVSSSPKKKQKKLEYFPSVSLFSLV
jgi:hypothetical protein